MNRSFFTHPAPVYKVPHDSISVRWLLIVHRAVARAFQLMRDEGISLANALEDDITIKLENVLNNQVLNREEIEGFNRVFFGKIRRVIVVNFDGTRKSKKPDLCFELQRESRLDWDQLQDAIFAECKPVDGKHPLKDHYCAVNSDRAGIARFVTGDYAWAMQEAFMIGYIREGMVVDSHLAAALLDETRRGGLGDPTPPELIAPSNSSSSSVALYRTAHQRIFTWRSGQRATPITLYHSWHDCS